MKKLVVVFTLFVSLMFPIGVSANSLDELTNKQKPQAEQNIPVDTGDEEGSLADYLRNYKPITKDSMQRATTATNPIVSALGTLSGIILLLTATGIFVITALDLMYIAIPPVRSLLNPQMAGGGSPMGGMGMGMGMAGGGQPAEHGLRRRWVSDEAVACLQMSGANTGSPMGGGAMGGMGMSMGGYGGMGMGMGGQAQPAPKSVIFTYLKKRTFFIIIFAIASTLLMSSLLMNTGLNIAELIVKILNKFNGQIKGVQV